MISSFQVQSGIEVALLPLSPRCSLNQYIFIGLMQLIDRSLGILAHSLLDSLLKVAVELKCFDDAASCLQRLRSVTDRLRAILVHFDFPLRI